MTREATVSAQRRSGGTVAGPAYFSFVRSLRGLLACSRRFGARAASLAAVVTVCLLAAGAAEAQTPVKLVSNAGQGDDRDANFVLDRTNNFTVGSHSLGYTLTSVVLSLKSTAATLPTYSVTIQGDAGADGPNGDDLGTGTLTTSMSLSDTYADIEFTAAGNGIHLDPGRYWVVLNVSSGDDDSFIRARSTGVDDPGAAAEWSIGNRLRYRNQDDSGGWTRGSVPLELTIYGHPTVPQLTASGDTLRLTFGKDLNSASVPATGAFQVTVDGEPASPTELDISGRMVTLTLAEAVGPGATVSVTYDPARAGGSPLRVNSSDVEAFSVSARTPEAQQQVFADALASVAAQTMAGALDTIGARLNEAVPVTGLALAGRPVPFGGSGVTGPDSAVRSGGAHSRGMESGELLGSSAFSLALGAAEGEPGFDAGAPRWGVWGKGDYGSFEGRADAGARYKGDMRTGWLGADARGTMRSGRWVAGLAVSRGTSETDYAGGRLETDLTALWPYGRWTFANGLELRGLAGMGRGTARLVPDGDGASEKSRLAMRAGALGLRQAFAPLDGFDLAARADASFARMQTAKGGEAVDGLRADAWRLRGGLEASRRFALQDGAALSPFAELAARRDGGDGVAGSGIELAGGVRYAAAGVSVEARGRWLAAHTENGVRERGLSAALRFDPEAGGRGLSLSLTPRWGAQAGGTGALWRDEAPGASGASEDGALDARLGYGFALAPGAGGVLTPFAEAGTAGGGDRRLRLGTRFEARGGALALELAGERRESANAQPEHAVRLGLKVGF